MMLPDLNETIKQLLIKKAPLEPSEMDIGFEATGREWGIEIQSKRAKEGDIDALQLFDDLLFIHHYVAGKALNNMARNNDFAGIMIGNATERGNGLDGT